MTEPLCKLKDGLSVLPTAIIVPLSFILAVVKISFKEFCPIYLPVNGIKECSFQSAFKLPV
jgi:hypothetical protein